MALIGKREDLIHVPWSSAEEWLQVYKQIYSGNLIEQKKACDALLVWKARIPKLPVGVECTLGLLQVCLRDQEWMPKINNIEMSVSYENDLRMMYSTVIMKFLNHISNIAHNKHMSLFIIAKQLNIPEWIVDLRHDIAHGYELPSIDVMRIVANILLTWLHEEYWSAEAKVLEESQEMEDLECLDSEDEENLIELIELWTAVGLYIKTKHMLVSDLPDTEIRETLSNMFIKLNTTHLDGSNLKTFSVNNDSKLATISNLLLLEISKNLGKGDSLIRREKIVIDCILRNEAFLTNPEILSIFMEGGSDKVKNCLPQSLINFWEDFLLLLQDKKILLPLFLRLIEIIKADIDKNKKLLASLWVKSIAQAFRKQKIARHIYHNLEQKFDNENKKLSMKSFLKIVTNEVVINYPDLKNVLSLNITGEFPNCLLNETFVKRLILNFTEFSEHFVPEILKISSFLNYNFDAQSKLLELIKIHSLSEEHKEMEVESTEEMAIEKNKETDRIFTVQNLKELENNKKSTADKPILNEDLADCKIRNTSWKIASDNYDWSSCPIGILPWQINDIQPMESSTISLSDIRYATVKNEELPKIIDSRKLQLHSKIQWENLLKKKKKTKKKVKLNETMTTAVVNRAMENAKNTKEQNL